MVRTSEKVHLAWKGKSVTVDAFGSLVEQKVNCTDCVIGLVLLLYTHQLMLRLRRNSVCPEKWQHWVCRSSSWDLELGQCCWDLFRKPKIRHIDNILTRSQRILWPSSHISRLLFDVHHLDHSLSRCPKYSNNAHSSILRRSLRIRVSFRSWRNRW